MTDPGTLEPDAEYYRKQLTLILEATGDGVYGIDTDGNATFVNPAAARMSGHAVEELIGRNIHDLVHHTRPDGSPFPACECPIYEATRDGKIHRVHDDVFWRKDGTSFPVEYISTPIWDEGRLVGAVVSFRDITERRLAEQALKDSEARYRAMFDGASAATLLIDADTHKVLDTNAAAVDLFGHGRETLEGMGMDALIVSGIMDANAFWSDARRDGRAETEGLCCRHANGERIPARIAASLIRAGHRDGLLVMVSDMRARRAIEARAQHLQSELQHVSRVSAMGEMASALAHELNQPLTAVVNYLNASRRLSESEDPSLRDQAPDYARKAIDQATRAAGIIKGLRRFVDKDEALKKFEDVNAIVEEALLLVVAGKVSDQLTLETQLAPDLPRTLVQPINVQQVVVNLVRNALEAMADCETGRLTVITRRAGEDEIEVCISDTGPGLTEEQQQKLFQPFSTTKSHGMGVGLSICQSIIADHDGRVWARNNPQGGACFGFALPIVKERDYDDE